MFLALVLKQKGPKIPRDWVPIYFYYRGAYFHDTGVSLACRLWYRELHMQVHTRNFKGEISIGKGFNDTTA